MAVALRWNEFWGARPQKIDPEPEVPAADRGHRGGESGFPQDAMVTLVLVSYGIKCHATSLISKGVGMVFIGFVYLSSLADGVV